MSNNSIIDFIEKIIIPFLIYTISYRQYKAQIHNNLLKPRIEFKKKFNQIFSYDYPESDLEPSNESLTKWKYIDKYEENLKNAKLEARVLFGRKIGKEISIFIDDFFNEYKEYKDKDDINIIFSKREGRFIKLFLLSLENKSFIIENYRRIESELNYFIYQPSRISYLFNKYFYNFDKYICKKASSFIKRFF